MSQGVTTTIKNNDNYLNHEKGIWSWLSTVDHKRIAVMYLVSVLTFFLVGGIFALLVRVALFNALPEDKLLDIKPEVYNQFMS